jgi:hypothetical protein
MFVNKLKMNDIAEAVKKCMAEDDLEETGLRKAAYAAHTKGEKMFTFKGKTYPVKVQGEDVSYGEAVQEESNKDLDARNKEIKDAKQKIRGEIIAQKAAMKSKTQKEETEIDEAMSGEVTRTKTGLVHRSTKAYGGSKPEKHVVDTLKGPKTKDLMKQDKEDAMKTRGKYDEEMEFKNKLIEALKGQQHKIDKNKNNKIDAQDFEMLRAQQKEEVELDEKEGYSAKAARAGKDIGKPGKAFSMIAKKAGERYGSAEAGKRVAGAILAKLRKEEADADWTEEQADALIDLAEKHMTDAEMKKREDIVKGMKKSLAGFKARYGARAKDVMYATATKQAMKEELDEAVSRKDFQMVADLIKTHDSHDKRKELAQHHAEIFHRQNPRFDRKKFMDAANVHEEIDPKVRTKDTLKGQEPTSQKDDVGPGSDAKSTKVKYRGGPMKEEVKKSDIPAFIRKARGDKPLTVADAKAGRKDSISSKENLAKARGVTEGKHPESDTVPFVTNTDQPPFDKPYTKIGGTVTDKSGAKHTPMSRARDLARSAMKRIKTEMLGKAPGNNG